jgi:phage terminase large subunit
LGTAHHRATCCWCSASLVIGEIETLRCWVCPRCWARQRQCALIVQDRKTGAKRCLYMPLPSQVLFEECPAKNVLWGGQAGPGKSHGVRWWLYKRSLTVPGHEGLLLRENWDQLEKTHLRKMQFELPLFGAKLVDKTARFPNGSFIDCGHMADAEAVSRYLSTEYGAIVPDEATQTPVTSDGTTPLAELSTRARKVYRDVNGQEVRPRFMPVSNPGGPSAAWLRDMFIDHTPDLEKSPALARTYDPAQWRYIPARLDDNPYQDPEYEDTLSVLSKWRFEQLRHGDWNVSSGQFFSEWLPRLHVRSLLAAEAVGA